MIICSKCGMDNQLGRVFCMSCGTKLDLSHMSTQSIKKDIEESWLSLHWKALVFIPLLVIVLLLVALVLWPNTGLVGESGTPAGGKKIEGQIASLASLKADQRFGPIVASEKEINGYLENVLAKKAKVSMNVKLTKGLVDVHMMNVFIDSGSGTNKFPIGLTWEAKCVPVDGGRLMIAQASVGHMPLVGPLRKIAEGVFGRAVTSEPSLLNLNSVDEITIDDGKLSVIVCRK